MMVKKRPYGSKFWVSCVTFLSPPGSVPDYFFTIAICYALLFVSGQFFQQFFFFNTKKEKKNICVSVLSDWQDLSQYLNFWKHNILGEKLIFFKYVYSDEKIYINLIQEKWFNRWFDFFFIFVMLIYSLFLRIYFC